MNNTPHPPRFFNRLFRWFCKDELYDELAGDLLEEYQMNLRSKNARKARNSYRSEVLRMIRPSVIKSLKSQHTQPNTVTMFRNYTLIAFRSFARNRLFSAINIFGLAVSMAVGLITIAFVSEMNSYDGFHENGDRIYRVYSIRTPLNEETQTYASSSVLGGKRLATDFAGFEAVAPIYRGLRGDFEFGEKTIGVSGLYTSSDFFRVFSFPLVYGNPDNALDEPYSIVITEATALKLFNKTDVVGEVLAYRGDQLKVTGVAANPPHNSHIQFEAIGALETLEVKDSPIVDNWNSMWSSYVYVLLPENHNREAVLANMNQMAAEENAKVSHFQVELGLESLSSIFPGDGKYNQMYTVMPRSNVNRMIILALIVIFSACFNYTNLSIARSLKRAREVGVRKVVGASKVQLFFQFITEAVMVSLFSLVLAFFLFHLIRPEFLSLNPYIERTTQLLLSQSTYLYFVLFAIATGIVAGLVPALVMTRLKTVSILKSGSKLKAGRNLSFRKVLIGLQFTLSMGFAVLVTLASKQYQFALNYDLGYTTENILNIDLQDNDPELIKTALASIPEVQGISSSNMIPSTGGTNSDYAKYKNPLDSVTVYTMDVDHNYLGNLNHQLIAGEGFVEGNTQGKAVVNTLMVEKFGIGSPAEALGEQFSYYGGKWTIVGVVENFHHGTMNNNIEPFAFTSGRSGHSNLNVKLVTNDMVASMGRLEKAWATVDPLHDLDASFYSDQIEVTYSDISASIKTFGLLATVAICISILGLLGMAVYNTESRMKELTIRKVLGASLSSLVGLLSKGFMVIFILSAAVAIPLAYWMFEETIVAYAVYKIDVGFWELSSGALLIIVIAFFTISSQTLKAARTNPAENLRNE